MKANAEVTDHYSIVSKREIESNLKDGTKECLSAPNS